MLGQLLFFSTETGDAWMLDPEDHLALCLAEAGSRLPVQIVETETRYAIEWTASYSFEDDAFVVMNGSGVRIIHGYPMRELVVAQRRAIRQVWLDIPAPRDHRLTKWVKNAGIVVVPLSQAALDTLAIIAYEQPITRADIRGIRSVDSDTAVETLRARGLIAEDPRFGGRGRPGFLITTPAFLGYFGLTSLTDLPPRDRSWRETAHS